jgi:ribosomal protein L23
MPVILQPTEVIKTPLVSEKSTFLANVKNSYTFVVDKKADKPQIKAAVEKYLPKDRRVELSVVPGEKK